MTYEEARRRAAYGVPAAPRAPGTNMYGANNYQRVASNAPWMGGGLPAPVAAPAMVPIDFRQVFDASERVPLGERPLPVIEAAPAQQGARGNQMPENYQEPRTAAAAPAQTAAPRAPEAAPAPARAPVNMTAVEPEAMPVPPEGAGNMLLTEGAGRLPQRYAGPVPRLFTDSDGVARAGFNMGEEGRRMGLVEADRRGIPTGVDMLPVSGLSQGEAEIGVPAGYIEGMQGPRRPGEEMSYAMPETPPPATPESYARVVSGIGGYESRPMNAREAALQADRDLTRANRWSGEGGPTSAMNIRSRDLRQSSAALDALTRRTDEDIRRAQQTPQASGAGNVMTTWDPRTQSWAHSTPPAEKGATEPLETRLKNVAAAIASLTGANVSPFAIQEIQSIKNEEERNRRWNAIAGGNSDLAARLSDYAASLLPDVLEPELRNPDGADQTGAAGTGGIKVYR